MNQHESAFQLPREFCTRMELLLGEEYDAFVKSFENPRTYGLRVNTAKISCEEFEKICPFPIDPIPWIPGGYFYPEDVRPSRFAFYQAGLYYLQDPGAMTPASRIPILPGDRVLDLCAAPGGKATAAGAALKGEGLLIANDISTSRARALLRNVELFGISNVFVASESPDKLCSRFPEYFNKIILDAPCSGEGMFRKEEALLRDWSLEKSRELSALQKELILQAADMLCPGGQMIYSTCTFSPEEDEAVIAHLLQNRPDMFLAEPDWYEGFSSASSSCLAQNFQIPAGISSFTENDLSAKCARIYPHKMKGEGHFLALLKKAGNKNTPFCSFSKISPSSKTDKNALQWIQDFTRELGLHSIGKKPLEWSRVEIRKDKVYYLPEENTDFRGITFLRNGLYMGDLKKNRFEPSQPLALALHKGDADSVISLDVSDERLSRYLRGETLNIQPGEAARTKGWHLLCVNGYPLGFGKLVNGILKNKYPAGWRV